MPRKKEPQKTRQKILGAAATEFFARGFSAASLEDILRQTGLTKGALYYHFGNKTELGYAVVEEIFEGMVRDNWLTPLAGVDDPLTRLGEIITAAIPDPETGDMPLGCPINNLALEMSTIDEGFRQRLARVYDRWRTGIARALARGQARGTVKRDMDPEATATFIVGALAGGRGLAQNARSRQILADSCAVLQDFFETLRPPARPLFKAYRKTGC
jgi:AcrR family transcriptional regulator